jgi:hypothetical protein
MAKENRAAPRKKKKFFEKRNKEMRRRKMKFLSPSQGFWVIVGEETYRGHNTVYPSAQSVPRG